jgi:hypothetical protein
MAIEKLYAYHALKPGSQIWILPEKNLSQWTRHLDWYMNFLISKAEKRDYKKISETLKQILSSEEIKLDVHPAESYDMTLLSTQDYFPNTATILLKNYSSPEQWVERITEILAQLRPKNFRVFLPQTCDINQFLKICKKDFEDMNVTLVEDLKANQ